MLPDPLDMMSEDDLPNESMADLAHACGIEVAKALMRALPGQYFIVPQNAFEKAQERAKIAGRAEIQPDDLPTPSWRAMAVHCGMGITLKVLEKGGNIRLLIPSVLSESLCRRFIREHFNGQNAVDVSVRLGISRSYLYKLLSTRGSGLSQRGSQPQADRSQLRLL